jgi:hypothetical protein
MVNAISNLMKEVIEIYLVFFGVIGKVVMCGIGLYCVIALIGWWWEKKYPGEPFFPRRDCVTGKIIRNEFEYTFSEWYEKKYPRRNIDGKVKRGEHK